MLQQQQFNTTCERADYLLYAQTHKICVYEMELSFSAQRMYDGSTCLCRRFQHKIIDQCLQFRSFFYVAFAHSIYSWDYSSCVCICGLHWLLFFLFPSNVYFNLTSIHSASKCWFNGPCWKCYSNFNKSILIDRL